VDTGVRHKVGLELGEIDVEGAIEAERGSQRGHDLGDQAVKVGVCGALNVKVATAYIVESLVIKTEGAVSVLQKRVRRKHVVIRFHDSCGDLRSRGHSEREFRFAAIVNGKTLKEKGAKPRSSSSAGRVEDQEALKTSAVVRELSKTVKDEIDYLLADGVVSTGIVVGSIFFSRDKLLGMVKLTVSTSADLVADTRLEIYKNSTGDVFSSACL